MSRVEAFTGIRYGHGLAALLVITGTPLTLACVAASGSTRLLTLVSTSATTLMCLMAGAYLSRVQIALTHRGLAYRAGLGRWRHFHWNIITTIEHEHVSTSSAFGFGVPQTPGTLRCLVGAGPALHLRTQRGDDIWLSVPDDLTHARLETYRYPTAR